MLGPENEGGAQAECEGTASEQVDARAEEVSLHAVGNIWARGIEADEGTVASNVADNTALTLHTLELDLEKSAGVTNVGQKVLLLDVLPCQAEVQELDHIYILFEGETFEVSISDLVESQVNS